MAESRMGDDDVEMIQIGLNFQGEDYAVTVDLETAHILLNDPDEADRFMQEKLQFRETEVNVEEHQSEEEGTNANCIPSSSKTLVWSSKRPTGKDNEATEFFLQLREKYSPKFNDRKTLKSQIWLQIVKDMNSAGYFVGSGKEGIEKVRLKFSNLQKQYLNYRNHVQTTGERKKDPPLFYALLHSILGDKDKVNPPCVQDSEKELNTTSDTGNKSSPVEVHNRFHSQSTSQLKPTSYNSKLLELMKEHHLNDQKERKEQFQKLENILQQQTRQKEEFLQIFKRLVDIKAKKRRQSPSSESE